MKTRIRLSEDGNYIAEYRTDGWLFGYWTAIEKEIKVYYDGIETYDIVYSTEQGALDAIKKFCNEKMKANNAVKAYGIKEFTCEDFKD